MRVKVASWIFLLCTAFALTAEVWSNDRPIVMSHQGSLYWPALGSEPMTANGPPDYARMRPAWALWPPNRWAPNDSNKTLATYPAPPSAVNWLGTDDRGRDVFARLLYGYRTSLLFAFAAWGACAILGTLFGALTGFFGGASDLIGQRVVEIVATVPQLFLVLYLVSVFEPSLGLLIMVTALLDWTYVSYYIRGEVLRLRAHDFVEAARALGAGRARVLFRHVLPNALSPLRTLLPFGIVANVGALAVLDYLGYGLPPPAASWGELLMQGQTYFLTAWWLVAFPALALLVVLLSLAISGESLLDTARVARVVERGLAWLERRRAKPPAEVRPLPKRVVPARVTGS